MKIKLDFVSNSSSTSFVYISDKELSEDIFLAAAGVDKNSPVADIFTQMYYEISSSIEQYGRPITTKDAADKMIGSHEFTPDVVDKMKEAIDQGKRVIVSNLSSDGSLAESMLCVTMFEINSEHFYINAYNNYW